MHNLYCVGDVRYKILHNIEYILNEKRKSLNMIGQFTCIEEKSGIYNERPWSHLILHTVFADGKVAQIKVKRDLFMKLNGNIPDNEVKKCKWDITTLTSNQNGRQVINLSYMEKA